MDFDYKTEILSHDTAIMIIIMQSIIWYDVNCIIVTGHAIVRYEDKI